MSVYREIANSGHAAAQIQAQLHRLAAFLHCLLTHFLFPCSSSYTGPRLGKPLSVQINSNTKKLSDPLTSVVASLIFLSFNLAMLFPVLLSSPWWEEPTVIPSYPKNNKIQYHLCVCNILSSFNLVYHKISISSPLCSKGQKTIQGKYVSFPKLLSQGQSCLFNQNLGSNVLP